MTGFRLKVKNYKGTIGFRVWVFRSGVQSAKEQPLLYRSPSGASYTLLAFFQTPKALNQALNPDTLHP